MTGTKIASKITSEMQEILEYFARFEAPPIETLSPEIARQLPELKDAVLAVMQNHFTSRILGGPIEEVDDIQHVIIDSVDGELLTRIYKPNLDEMLPVVLYFHGGGWVIGNINSYDASCRAISNAAGCIVISVAYRQAPEHPYPAAHEDAYTAYKWLLENAEKLGGDPSRIAICGESAGGNLAASVCLRARDEGFRLPVHQVLIYPITDYNFETESYNEQCDARPLSRLMMKWFWDHYAQAEQVQEQLSKGYLTPLSAQNLLGLPGATFIIAELDPLRTEAEAYADRLHKAGISVHSTKFEGVTHEFFGMGIALQEAKEAVAIVASNLKHAFSQNHDAFSYTPDEFRLNL